MIYRLLFITCGLFLQGSVGGMDTPETSDEISGYTILSSSPPSHVEFLRRIEEFDAASPNTRSRKYMETQEKLDQALQFNEQLLKANGKLVKTVKEKDLQYRLLREEHKKKTPETIGKRRCSTAGFEDDY